MLMRSKFITSKERKRPTNKKESSHPAVTLKSEIRNDWLEKTTLCREGPRLDFSGHLVAGQESIYCHVISYNIMRGICEK